MTRAEATSPTGQPLDGVMLAELERALGLRIAGGSMTREEATSPTGQPVDDDVLEELRKELRTAGDVAGHEFHGNQWTSGTKGQDFSKLPAPDRYFSWTKVTPDQAGSVKWYHGTTTKNAQKILTEGLKPADGDPVVWMTSNLEDARRFAIMRANHDEENRLQGTILQVKIPANAKMKLEISEHADDAWTGGVKAPRLIAHDVIPPEWITPHSELVPRASKVTRDEWRKRIQLPTDDPIHKQKLLAGAAKTFYIVVVDEPPTGVKTRHNAAKHPIHAAADAFVAKFNVAVRYAFAQGRKALGTPTPRPERAAKAINAALLEVLPPLLVKVAVAGAGVGLAKVEKLVTAADTGTLKIKFDGHNPKAVTWAKEHAAELAKGISDVSLESIRQALADSQEKGHDPYPGILDAVGDEDRASLIARHETMVAANEGQRMAWDQATEDGLLTGGEHRAWIVTDDDRLCELCEPLDGAIADLNGEYPDDGGDGPPLHVNCRCTEGLVD